VRIRIRTVRVDVGPNPVARLRHLAGPGRRGGYAGEDLVEGLHRLDADVAGQVAHGADLFGGYGTGLRGRRQCRQLPKQPASGQPAGGRALAHPSKRDQPRPGGAEPVPLG
jgi:hypothetical protein